MTTTRHPRTGRQAKTWICSLLVAAGLALVLPASALASAPSASTFNAFSTGATTATVEGEVNPAGQSTKYQVAYDLASSEWCTSFGSKGSPASSTTPVTLGFTDATFHPVSVPLSGLTAGKEYCAELVASNGSGTSHGNQASFTAGAPSAVTFTAVSTGATTATVEGEVNPSGQSTQYHVAYGLASSEWCTSHGSSGSPASSTTPVTLGFTDATFHRVSVPLSGLTAGKEYCAELVASNGSGTSHGNLVSFTAGAPSAFTFNAFSTGATTATVEGGVNPAGLSTQYHVAYGLASSEWCTSHGSSGSPASSTTPVTLGFTDATFHPVSVPLSGLTAGKEYCAELIASNGSGTSQGNQASFTAGAPSAVTFTAVSTGATTATVEGEVNPSGQSTQYHVAYGLASSEWCTSHGSSGSPASSTTPVTLGFTDATFHRVSVPLSGLTAGKEYCAELIASNGSGTSQGNPASFTAGAPSAFTFNAFSTGATTATVEGGVNPAGLSTQYHVAYGLASSEWCTSHGSSGSPASSTTPVTLGFTDATFHPVSVPLSGLTAGKEYCAELIASNGSGTSQGNQASFTAGAPSAVTFTAVSTGATTATVEGEVNPSGQSTQYHVAYGLASSEWCTSHGSSGSPASSTTPVTLGFTDEALHPVSVPLSGLTAGKEYCVELVASNGSGTSHGFQFSFTAGSPSVTFNVFSTGATTATVEGGVNPAGLSTQYHVAYGLASSEWCTSFGSSGSPASSTAPVTLGFTDEAFHPVSVPLSGLTAGKEYCVELVASNGSGTSHGFQFSFTAGSPSVFTSNAFSTGATTATVEGGVNPAGQATEYHVAYGLVSSEWCTSFGSSGSPASSTTPVTLGFTDETFHPVSVPLSGLTAGKEYCAELVASNGSGTAHGGQVRFSTPADEAARKQHEEEAAATKKHEEEAAAKKRQEEEAAATAAKKHQEEEAAATAAKKHQEEEAAAKIKKEKEEAAQIATLLGRELTPSGKAAKIAALLKSGMFSISFKALHAGTAVINWYQVPPGAKLANKAKPKPVLVASGHRSFSAAGTAKIQIKLTAAGKRLLKHAKQLKLTAKGTFTPTGKAPITATKVFVLKR